MTDIPAGLVLGAALWVVSGIALLAQDRPLTADDVAALLSAGSTPAEVVELVKQRGYRGGAEAADLKRLKDAGADAGLLMQVREAADRAQGPEGTSGAQADPTAATGEGGVSDANSQYRLGCKYRDGVGVAQDYVEAAKWFRKAAEQGHADAQNSLGLAYHNGSGVEKDDAEAVRWYRKAAAQGDAPAQYNLGNSYSNGWGVDQDKVEAVKWWREAAEQGQVFAQHNLGRAYYNGQGVEKDDGEAVKWYRKAAEQGDSDAQHSLGHAYYNGRGIEKDEAEAVKWWRKAAEQGQALAQNNLGFAYYNGRGVEKDDVEAVKWYRKAAAQGHATAQRNLQNAYESGRGVDSEAKLSAGSTALATDQARAEINRLMAAGRNQEALARAVAAYGADSPQVEALRGYFSEGSRAGLRPSEAEGVAVRVGSLGEDMLSRLSAAAAALRRDSTLLEQSREGYVDLLDLLKAGIESAGQARKGDAAFWKALFEYAAELAAQDGSRQVAIFLLALESVDGARFKASLESVGNPAAAAALTRQLEIVRRENKEGNG